MNKCNRQILFYTLQHITEVTDYDGNVQQTHPVFINKYLLRNCVRWHNI